MTPPDVGVLLPTRAILLRGSPPTDLEEVLLMAEALEEAGYGSVWVGDSLLASPRPEVTVTLSAIAARTKRIRLGSGILISSLRHPVHMAHQFATVDLVSAGRLTVGIGYSSGTGLWRKEHDLVGVDVSSRHERTRESISVLRMLWGDSPATHEGRFFKFDNVQLEPKPAQKGGPPIWLHGMRGERTLERVAQYGDGWINNLPTTEAFSESWEIIRSHLSDSARDLEGFSACHYSTLRMGSDGGVAARQGRAFMQAYYGGMDPDEIEGIECCRYGTPEFIAGELRSFVEAGASTLILRFASDNQAEQMELCTEYVLPALGVTGGSL